MLMTFGLIALAIAMIVGPIMMLQPTQGMARIARLRTLASQNGLSVQLVPKSESPQAKERAKYSIAWRDPQRKTNETRGWSLVMMNISHDIHFFGKWDWVGKGRATEAYIPEIKALLETLPEGYYGVVSNGGGVGVIWDERCLGRTEETALSDVKSLLSKLRNTLEPQ